MVGEEGADCPDDGEDDDDEEDENGVGGEGVGGDVEVDEPGEHAYCWDLRERRLAGGSGGGWVRKGTYEGEDLGEAPEGEEESEEHCERFVVAKDGGMLVIGVTGEVVLLRSQYRCLRRRNRLRSGAFDGVWLTAEVYREGRMKPSVCYIEFVCIVFGVVVVSKDSQSCIADLEVFSLRSLVVVLFSADKTTSRCDSNERQ